MLILDIVKDIKSLSERTKQATQIGHNLLSCAQNVMIVLDLNLKFHQNHNIVRISHESWKFGAFKINYVTIQRSKQCTKDLIVHNCLT